MSKEYVITRKLSGALLNTEWWTGDGWSTSIHDAKKFSQNNLPLSLDCTWEEYVPPPKYFYLTNLYYWSVDDFNFYYWSEDDKGWVDSMNKATIYSEDQMDWLRNNVPLPKGAYFDVVANFSHLEEVEEGWFTVSEKAKRLSKIKV